MPDEMFDLRAEVQRSRESSAQLLDTFAHRIGTHRLVRGAAQYVHSHSVKDLANGIEKTVRSSPAPAIALAIVAGFLVGRALRSR